MLLPKGHVITHFEIDQYTCELIESQDWQALDKLAANWLSPGGKLAFELSKYSDFESIEHILAIRCAPDDEDGIWHDDGSRLLAFSLSLTLDHSNVIGGEVSIRKRGNEAAVCISCQPIGTLIVFNTGQDDYEHRVSAVTRGKRLVLAGWCT